MPTGDTYAVVSDEVGDLATVDRPNTTGVGTCPADPADATKTVTGQRSGNSLSGISWAIGNSAPRSRQITTPAPHFSSFFTGRMPFLPPNQQCQSTEGILYINLMGR